MTTPSDAAVAQFIKWFYSAEHRKKYTNDHPAFLAAYEAWIAAREIDALRSEVDAGGGFNGMSEAETSATASVYGLTQPTPPAVEGDALFEDTLEWVRSPDFATPPGEAVSGLPELPPHVTTIGPCMFGGEPKTEVRLYTADQMRACAIEALAKRPEPAVEVTDADIDVMRDVYMTRQQLAAYERILTAAKVKE